MEIWNTMELSSTVFDEIPCNYSPSGIFYMLNEGERGERGERDSSCFIDTLGLEDFSPSIFDFLQQTPSPLSPLPPTSATPPCLPDTSEILNIPTTPNSSSVSSSSGERSKTIEVEKEDQEKSSKKQLKPNKKNNKKQLRQPRFAFMTKSEVDQLDDSYRWRKYGQKAVKNSPFPRSYYRCTNATCGVKKRLERSCEDPSVVVTTYEGQHTHPIPASSSRGSTCYQASVPSPTTTHYRGKQFSCFNSLASSHLSFGSTSNFNRENSLWPTTPPAYLHQDCGLLQDLVYTHTDY